MLDLSTILLYRMTHIENVPHILKHGITHLNSEASNKKYVPIGDGSLITTRSTFEMPDGSQLGEYIPFYFGPRMPMLYVIQNGFNNVKRLAPAEIVYCVTSVKSIIDHELGFAFTDGHAVDALSEFYKPKDAKRIEKLLDWAAIGEKYWRKDDDLDLKRRKEAEFLLQEDLPLTGIEKFIVYSISAKEKITEMKGYDDQTVIVKPNYYF
jgi:hypothetical protein